ncbi:hypothetical protein [Niveispirillum sp.]|uniref:hypothetical protein n=1 Tax=Niveispirillum sp. TaxID=1917217 RepID=UPI001B6EC27E|nr:hypothetical protein [Niveispirillum sp.]MBP7339355.1 hypothetical protein [Niveispirillum sp.]
MTRSDKPGTEFDRGTTGDQVPSLKAAPPPGADIKTAGTRPAATLDVPGITPASPAGKPSRTAPPAAPKAGTQKWQQRLWVPAGLALLGLGAALIAARR